VRLVIKPPQFQLASVPASLLAEDRQRFNATLLPAVERLRPRWLFRRETSGAAARPFLQWRRRRHRLPEGRPRQGR